MFTDKIQTLADKKGVTIAKMLRELDLANSIFSKWKMRGSVPNVETVKKIADYFQVSVDYLLDKEKSPPSNDSELLKGIMFEIENSSEAERTLILEKIKQIKSLRNE